MNSKEQMFSGQMPEASGDQNEKLSEKEARSEYLMLRYKLGLDRNGYRTKLNEKSGEFEKEKPTIEEIDEAYEAVSELIRLAEEEPLSRKFIMAFKRYSNAAIGFVGFALPAEAEDAGKLMDRALKEFEDERMALKKYKKLSEKYAEKLEKDFKEKS